MAKDLLLEIGLEEVPARFVRGGMTQLQDKVAKWLTASRIEHGAIEAFATPRRFAVLVRDVAEKQADVHEEVKGPSRKIALDQEGNWSKAALGFARSQGVDPAAFFFKELAGVEYVYANKSSIGTDTASVLAEGLQSIITSMTFPKNMRWGAYDFKFVRPIRWLVAMYGSDVVPFEITGVSTGNVSRGHRFLGAEATFATPADYVEKLRAQSVLVDVAERQQLIESQIQALAAEQKWTIAIKEDLLEEVLFLVEYPNVLFGTFDPSFLNIPQEVLITSMREHQRYFPVLDEAGKLLPFFVTVRNGDRTSIEQVARGNEKVLRARLSDAKFFYAEDQKLAIVDALAKLETIVYHEELGSVADKVRRIVATAKRLSETLQVSAAVATAARRTAEICKFDLVTAMVYEFPELQGVMGEDYARKAGEPENVAVAINEHYQPRFSGDQAPPSLVGALVSLADKIDTIVGCFSIGIIPTGSQDPYALRRQAAGIVQIILAHGLELTLPSLFDTALAIHSERGMKRDVADVRRELQDFFALRIKNVLESQGIRYDVIDAVMASGASDVLRVVNRASALATVTTGDNQATFKLVADALQRVCNLAAKAEHANVQPQLFVDDVERVLYEAACNLEADVADALVRNDATAALTAVAHLQKPITAYFDKVMVMVDDEATKQNRLATLAVIARMIQPIADLSKLVW